MHTHQSLCRRDVGHTDGRGENSGAKSTWFHQVLPRSCDLEQRAGPSFISTEDLPRSKVSSVHPPALCPHPPALHLPLRTASEDSAPVRSSGVGPAEGWLEGGPFPCHPCLRVLPVAPQRPSHPRPRVHWPHLLGPPSLVPSLSFHHWSSHHLCASSFLPGPCQSTHRMGPELLLA